MFYLKLPRRIVQGNEKNVLDTLFWPTCFECVWRMERHRILLCSGPIVKGETKSVIVDQALDQQRPVVKRSQFDQDVTKAMHCDTLCNEQYV